MDGGGRISGAAFTTGCGAGAACGVLRTPIRTGLVSCGGRGTMFGGGGGG